MSEIGTGSINFWMDPNKNPGAFTDGVNYRWGEFKLDADRLTVVSEGTTLIATLNQGEKSETMIFSTDTNADPDQRHMITISWEPAQMKLSFDDEEIASYDR